MSNPLQLSVCFRETRVWKKKERFSWAHLPVDLPVTLWPGDCVVESQHMSSTGWGRGAHSSHWACPSLTPPVSNLELPDGACPNHRKARLSPGFFRSRGTQINTRMLNSYKIRLEVLGIPLRENILFFIMLSWWFQIQNGIIERNSWWVMWCGVVAGEPGIILKRLKKKKLEEFRISKKLGNFLKKKFKMHTLYVNRI